MTTTFFYNQPVGYFSSETNVVRGSLFGDVERNGTKVLLKNLRITLTCDVPVIGLKNNFTITIGSSSSTIGINVPTPKTSLGTYSLNNSTINGVPLEYSNVSVSWNTSDARTGSFIVSIPAYPTEPSLESTNVEYDAIELKYSVSSFGTPSTGVLSLVDCTDGGYSIIDNTTSAGVVKTFLYRNLKPNKIYSFKAIADNHAVSRSSNEISVQTLPQPKVYGPVNGRAKQIRKLYGEIGGETKQIVKLYGSVDGKTKRVL